MIKHIFVPFFPVQSSKIFWYYLTGSVVIHIIDSFLSIFRQAWHDMGMARSHEHPHCRIAFPPIRPGRYKQSHFVLMPCVPFRDILDRLGMVTHCHFLEITQLWSSALTYLFCSASLRPQREVDIQIPSSWPRAGDWIIGSQA